MDQKYFSIINNKVNNVLEPLGYKKNNVTSESDEITSLFTGSDMAYMIIYHNDRKVIVLQACAMAEDGPDNEWKSMATWMFDPETDGEKEAESIGNDFAETLRGPVKAKARSQKKKKNSDDGNADPLFFSKRLVNVFPELKDEIRDEQDGYDPFRGVTFTKEHIVPKVNALLKGGSKQDINKLGAILNAQYNNGDIDTRSIITIVVLNSIDTKESESIMYDALDDELKRAWDHAKKYKGKKVKPEKKKAKKLTMAERLGVIDSK